ncbi:ribosome-associated protein [Corynebacterium glaucum]|uniref:Ribosome-associated protein n=1 Tax=Corynebacterium glaucum TaxID=187491 RepID=A0A1Q2HTC8_9CORY|nr:RNA-binding S4 domain-containing protein [Corynebacterium glaucum]AQQ14082.1 ribosome-associated protein [Corynebacterium glaucum]WJZ06604.1 ribosome-associated protein [Corynebacterium glaucum]
MHIEVPIAGESIKLGQFLKLANLAESGGHAKELIAEGEVQVDGEVVSSRGFSLGDGARVTVGDTSATVVCSGEDGEDDYFDERTANDDFDPEKWRNM